MYVCFASGRTRTYGLSINSRVLLPTKIPKQGKEWVGCCIRNKHNAVYWFAVRIHVSMDTPYYTLFLYMVLFDTHL